MTTWRKSSYSDTSGNDCVEIAQLPSAFGVRDSKNPAGPHLALGGASFAGLLARIKRGEVDF